MHLKCDLLVSNFAFFKCNSYRYTEAEQPSFELKRGALIAGKFTGDDCWYRAVVTENPRNAVGGGVKVFYQDFGNGEALPPRWGGAS